MTAFALQSCVFADAQIIWLSTGKNDFTDCQQQERKVAPFTGIYNHTPFEVILVQSDEQSVLVEGDEYYFDRIRTEVRNNRLEINLEKGRYRNVKLRVTVTCPEITAVSVMGSGNIRCTSDIITDRTLSVAVAGSGDIETADIKSAGINISVAGSGDIETGFINTAGRSSIEVAGSGDIDVQSLTATDSEIKVAGSGDIKVHSIGIDDNLSINVAGSGDVLVNGRADKVSVTVVGSGDVNGNVKYNKITKSGKGSGDIKI